MSEVPLVAEVHVSARETSRVLGFRKTSSNCQQYLVLAWERKGAGALKRRGHRQEGGRENQFIQTGVENFTSLPRKQVSNMLLNEVDSVDCIPVEADTFEVELNLVQSSDSRIAIASHLNANANLR